MKILITTCLLFGCCSLICAQNSVTITQQGEGNRASISQSSGSDEDCVEAITEGYAENKNIISVVQQNKKTRLFEAAGETENKLFLSQTGTGAKSIFQSWPYPDSVAATQQGTSNGISIFFDKPNADARSYKEGNHLTLNQEGKDNRITINPCTGKNSTKSISDN